MASFASQSNALRLILNASFLLLLLLFNLLAPVDSFHAIQSSDDSTEGCNLISSFATYEEKCAYVTSESQCDPEGYIDYLYLFYCESGKHPLLGYTALALWLVLLFYLLGNTTANYFCSNLEALSKLLRLSPTIAGVTLLSLGNGAPDVFSSIVSFMGTSSTSEVGLSSILGGTFFVSSVVVGILSICIASRKISVDKSSFLRDLCFFLFVLLVLLAILVIGRINLWGAMAFASLYLVYVLLSFIHLGTQKKNESSSCGTKGDEELGVPLLGNIKEGELKKPNKSFTYYCSRVLYFLELPLYLPRRLTIPDVSEERWSKPFGVISVTMAPILLAVLWDSKEEELGSKKGIVIYLLSGFVGIVFGIAAAAMTGKERPPSRLLLPWLAGGFLMSVVWTYLIAEELVSLLVSVGQILGISPSVLGLTVLAWGNSLGDLIANVAMALDGGPGGTQVAMSGCYAGPIFNTLVGLGLSLVLSTWARYPSSMDIPRDPTLFQTLGFLVSGLLWSLVILPRREMKLDRVLGCGLICIYLCFLSVRLCQVFWAA